MEIYTSSLIESAPVVDAQLHFFTIMEPYLNSLKLIYNSIKQAKLNDGAEERYIELMKSYLTNYEVMFIVVYYNYLQSLGQGSSLSNMYNELEIVNEFAYRMKRAYGYELIPDAGIV